MKRERQREGKEERREFQKFADCGTNIDLSQISNFFFFFSLFEFVDLDRDLTGQGGADAQFLNPCLFGI